jgi:hypothetical protein
LPGIFEDETCTSITYVHLVFDTHQIVFAEGAPSESFYNGEASLAGLTSEARRELLSLFPAAMLNRPDAGAVRPILQGAQARELARRLGKNEKTASIA